MLDTSRAVANAVKSLKGAFRENKHDIIADIRGVIWNSHLTFEKISALSGVGAQTISRWASGETKSPQLLKVLAVANVLGYDLKLVKRVTH